MTVRFKCQSEYQKSFSVPRSRSVSPQRRVPFAGLRSNQMGVCREPGLQRRKRPSSLGVARSFSSLFYPADDPAVGADRRAPTAASRNCSANRKKRSPNPKPPQPPESTAVPETPVGPRPATDSRPQDRADPESSVRPGTGPKSGKPHPSEPDSLSQPSRPVTGEAPTEQQPSANQIDSMLQWNVGLRPRGQRSEYNRQFGWKKPVPAASPLLTAEQAHSRKKAENTKEKSQIKNNRSQSPPKTMPPPPQVYKRRRNPEGGGATDDFTQQLRELREKAQLYRHRAWGTNFCRDHLSQLLSEHTAMWEPTDTTDSTPHLNDDISPELDSCSTSCVEALDLASNSSKNSSVVGSGETNQKHQKRNLGTKTPTASSGEQRTAWGEEDENTDGEEGRLPTPRLKTKPVQRTHHDLTTPATGGAVLVGKLKSTNDSSSNKQPKSGMAVTVTTGAEIPTNRLTKHKEAWMKKAASSPAAPPTLISSPQHVIQGTLRHPDFQHNGELGLRFLPCSRGGCGSDEDDCLSVLSWRSAASCSAASTILERAQKRRESFWGKR